MCCVACVFRMRGIWHIDICCYTFELSDTEVHSRNSFICSIRHTRYLHRRHLHRAAVFNLANLPGHTGASREHPIARHPAHLSVAHCRAGGEAGTGGEGGGGGGRGEAVPSYAGLALYRRVHLPTIMFRSRDATSSLLYFFASSSAVIPWNLFFRCRSE